MLSTKSKSRIKKSFEQANLKILSSDQNGNICYKTITDVLRHYCPEKRCLKIKLGLKSIVVTEDHSLFSIKTNKIFPIKATLNLSQVVVRNNKKCILKKVKAKQDHSRKYMYDLSVSENENFFLTSGFLAHNSFSPPSKEATVAGFTRTRGYRWTDDSLYMHLVQACNYINLIPPDTAYDLIAVPAPWQPLLLLQAMSYALMDLAILWVNEEFAYNLNGYSFDLTRSDKYMNAAQTIQTQVDAQLTEAKRRLHYTIGLRQSRYTMSYGGFFGPWTSGRMSVKKWVLGFGTQAGKGFG